MELKSEKYFKKIFRELAVIKKQLGNTISKDDIKQFATKDDLKNFATKDDLKNFPTKDDAAHFLTKDDAKNFATKDDLKNFPTKDDAKNYLTKKDAERFYAHFVSKHEFYELVEYIKENMFTKKDYMEHLSYMNEMLNEVQDNRRSRLLFEKQFVELDDTVAIHENRITTLEKKTGHL